MWSAVTRAIASICSRKGGKKRSSESNSSKIGNTISNSETLQASNSKDSSKQKSNMTSGDQVSEYLTKYPDFLENYIMDKVEVEQLERWIIRKSQRMKKKFDNSSSSATKGGRKTSLSRWKFCVHADKRQMLQDLTHSLQIKPTKDHVLWELANCICSAVSADGFRLFLVNPSEPDKLTHFLDPECTNENGEPTMQNKRTNITVSKYVARTQEPIRLSRGKVDAKYPDGIMDELPPDIYHVQCQPIIQANGEIVAVLELWRRDKGGAFHEEDEEIASSYLVWGGIALHYAQLYLNMNQQKKLNDFLLLVVKSIFQDMVSMDVLVMKVMNFAQRLVDADRASLFLVDAKNKELYATIFDVGVNEGGSSDVYENQEIKIHTSKEIRFPLGTGIAGQVAMTGEVLNIKDAYADSRFNRTVDQLTGYKTRTILCMPIYIRGSIIGVVQMVNKHFGFFTKHDEEAFATFAVYCGLALHHAKLYDKIRKSQQKYKVALEVLSYHNTCSDEEYEAALQEGIPKEIIGVDDYYFNPFNQDDHEKIKQAIFMFADLFGLNGFDQKCLLKFTMTVKKNYRRVPYHNWTHGFSVANSMYCIIKHSKEVFDKNECLALYISALCHDLDHRGKNNKFMLDTESPLASIYSTSTMEHHHFNQTVTILQQEGHNIFGKLSNTDYKQLLGLIKHCILATDLAVFFPNKAKLGDLVNTSSFSWSNSDHRRLILAIAMTGSDLCASAKPWDIQVETVKVIFEEFYEQGDAERAAGRTPIPMMDRYQPDQQPSSQVGFLTGICIPCYSLLNTLIPETKPMLDMCNENLAKWREIDKEIKIKRK